jgi:hypothetical protein
MLDRGEMVELHGEIATHELGQVLVLDASPVRQLLESHAVVVQAAPDAQTEAVLQPSRSG